jgi:hypothetical protein
MSTTNSSATSFCSAASLVARYDWRTVGDLLLDSDDDPPLTRSQVLASTDLAALLLASSGEVEAACQVSNRYTQLDLAAIAASGCASAELLADLVADLCMWRLFKRRPLRDSNLKPPTACEDARKTLEDIRRGERIFGLVEHAEAGLTDSPQESAQDVVDRNGISVQAERYLGSRGWRKWQ